MAKNNGKQEEQAYIPPSFDDTEEFGAVIPAKWHDFSLCRMWDTVSSSGNPQLVGIFVADNGEHAGQRVYEYYPLGLPSKIGEGKLKSLGVKSGFKWKGGIPLDEFAKQFVDFDDPLRISGLVQHQYSIKAVTGGWKNVDKKVFDDWEGDKNIRASLRKYGVAKDEADLELECAYGDPATEFKEGQDEEEDEYEDYEEYDEDLDAEEDDVPF